MRRFVTLSFTIDANQYFMVKDTPKGTLALVKSILKNEADWPTDEGAAIDIRVSEVGSPTPKAIGHIAMNELN